VNVIVRNLILEWFGNEGKKFDITCADYDGACFKVTAEQPGTFVTVSFKAPAADSLLKNGGKDYLPGVYKEFFSQALPGYDVTLNIPYTTPQNDRAAIAQKCATLKSYLFASVILQRMEAAGKGQTIPGLIDIALRSHKERMWVKQDGLDRITVIFSIEFPAHNDAVLGQVFCQEFTTVKDGGVPSVSYSAKAPSELKEIRNVPDGKGVSYLTFVIYDRHWKGTKMETSAFNIAQFRNYLHYHLKCCKSYLHTRMRMRVENLLKVLNRAKQATTGGEKKTAAGRTFTRK